MGHRVKGLRRSTLSTQRTFSVFSEDRVFEMRGRANNRISWPFFPRKSHVSINIFFLFKANKTLLKVKEEKKSFLFKKEAVWLGVCISHELNLLIFSKGDSGNLPSLVLYSFAHSLKHF